MSAVTVFEVRLGTKTQQVYAATKIQAKIIFAIHNGYLGRLHEIKIVKEVR